jgi:hypothetical protein
MGSINIRWKKHISLQFLGRNGNAYQTGVQMYNLSYSKAVIIYPWTSKDQVGRAYMCIPAEHLTEVIKGLQQLKSELDEQEAQKENSGT